MNICNTYNVTIVPIIKCEIIKHTHTHKLKLTTNLSNPKNFHDPFIVNNQTTSTLNNPSQPQPTKFGKKKKKKLFSRILFSWETKKRKLWSLSIICFPICYTNGIYSSKDNVLRGTKKDMWHKVGRDCLWHCHLQTWFWTEVELVGGLRSSKFLKSNWDWIEVISWWCYN